jgi:hypothetical protein
MKRAALLPVLAILAFAFPTGAGAALFHGVVVAKQTSRHALIVASPNGTVRTVRTGRMDIRAGARLVVHARKLPDGTYRSSALTVRSRVRHAHVRAVVVRLRHGRMVVSAGHSAFTIRTARRFINAGVAGSGPGPQPGDVIDAKVTISQTGELEEEDMDEVGQADTIELNGTLTAMTPPTDTTPGSLTVKVGGLSFDIVVPPGGDVSKLKVGDRVHVKASVDGTTLTLVKVGQDDDQGEDDDEGGGGGDD